MIRQPHRIGRALASLAALVVLFVIVPVGLVAGARSRFGGSNPLGGIAPPWRWRLDELGDAVAEPLRDDAVVNLLIRSSLTIVWLALAVIGITIVTEVIHMVRHQGLAAPRVRGVGWSQGIARWVAVGLIAVLPVGSVTSAAPSTGVAGPTATALRLAVADDERGSLQVAPTDRFDASRDPDATRRADVDVFAGGPAVPEPDAVRDPAGHRTVARGVHLVERGESIYAIAAEYAAGDEVRTIEIAEAILDLNLDTVMDDGQRFTNPALIQPGWTLTLPDGVGAPAPAGGLDAVPDTTGNHADDDPTPVHGLPRAADDDAVTTYVVVRGDTLSDIAAEHLGDQDEWPAIWEENRGDDMGGGRTFDDPSLILPGWELDVPAVADATPVVPAPSRPDPSDGGSGVDDLRSGDPADTIVPRPSTAPDPATVDSPVPRSDAAVPTTSVPSVAPGEAPATDVDRSDVTPTAPAPIRLEHAALLAAGILTLVGVRRRRSLRSALPHARVPAPPPEVARVERRLRMIDAGERGARIDVAVRAAAHRLADSGVRIGAVRLAKDGELVLRLTGDAVLRAPWAGHGATWRLPAAVPIELLSEDARQVGQPCLALVTIGIDDGGDEVLLDLEAAGVLTVEADSGQADDVVRAIGSGLASSLNSEVVHLLVASLGADCLFDHPNAREVANPAAALRTATALVGSTLGQDRSSFDLRARRTGGEMWEPAVALFASDDGAIDAISGDVTPPPGGHGLAVVVACRPGDADAIDPRPARIVGDATGWTLDAFGETIAVTPLGVTAADVADVGEILADAGRPIDPDPPVRIGFESGLDTPPADDGTAEPLQPLPHDIVVGLMGPVTIRSADGVPGEFERSKTVELIAWLATHRERATRAAARTALWEMDVRDATFANVVSEARRALGRLVEPPPGEEWLARTLTELLPLHERVVTDADLIGQRVEHARLAPPAHAIDVLRPAVEMIRDLPFAGTGYLWPDAEGITSSLVLLATTAAAELAGHALSIGDTDLVFWATGHGLKVLPGHEELIGLRMRAHARSGDLAGVRQEWESYERVIMSDAWSDGEPAPKLLDLRRELLTAP